jgi:preprotein translocase subunit Sec63
MNSLEMLEKAINLAIEKLYYDEIWAKQYSNFDNFKRKIICHIVNDALLSLKCDREIVIEPYELD